MVRPVTLLFAIMAALLAPVLLVAPGQAAPSASRAWAGAPDPLAVTIDSLTPAVVPESGPVVITGTVTNESSEQWRGINVYAMTSSLPLTTHRELRAAIDSDPELPVGERITEAGAARIEVLDPGATGSYHLRVPRRLLGIGNRPGVYWIGIHALGETDAGRDTIADGKARTFIPLVHATGSVDTALILPVRRGSQQTADGRVSRTDTWVEDLVPTGGLSRTLSLAEAAGSRPVNWLLDQRVVDTVAQLAAGNPADDLGPFVAEPGPTTQSPSEEVSAPGLTDPVEPATSDADTAALATAWLARLTPAQAGDAVLLLPYGDLDVAAVLRSEGPLDWYTVAREHAALAAQAAGITQTVPTTSAPAGYLDPTDIAELPEDTLTVADRRVLAGRPAAVNASVHDRRVLFSLGAGLREGPGPDDPLAGVAVRQRILSEAALQLESGEAQPLAVTFPSGWAPTDPTGFFTGLDQPWLRLVGIPELLAAPPTPIAPEAIQYPRWQREAELTAGELAAPAQLVELGRSLRALFAEEDPLGREVIGDGLSAASYISRFRHGQAQREAAAQVSWLTDQLELVTISGPPSLTLSSDQGALQVLVENGLNRPVQVQITATSDAGMRVESGVPVMLAPGAHRSMLLDVSATRLGPHTVRLALTDPSGAGIGEPAVVPIRASPVSQVIWWVVGIGLALLFATIVMRLFKRVRQALAGPEET